MFIFGHIGITIGAGMLIEAITNRRYKGKGIKESVTKPSINSNENKHSHLVLDKPKLLFVGKWLDYRLLLLASMLPDIIDKPLGQVFLGKTISNGRIYAHTFIFVLITGILGILVFKKWGKGWLLIMSFGSFMHQMEDQMWRWPQVLWWPLKGWAFPKEDLNAWLSSVFQTILTEPETFIPELVGIAILTLAAIKVFRNKHFIYTLKTGHIS